MHPGVQSRVKADHVKTLHPVEQRREPTYGSRRRRSLRGLLEDGGCLKATATASPARAEGAGPWSNCPRITSVSSRVAPSSTTRKERSAAADYMGNVWTQWSALFSRRNTAGPLSTATENQDRHGQAVWILPPLRHPGEFRPDAAAPPSARTFVARFRLADYCRRLLRSQWWLSDRLV